MRRKQPGRRKERVRDDKHRKRAQDVNQASGIEGNAFIGPEGVLAKRRAYFYPCTQHFYRQPPQIVRGSMQYLYDHEGRRYTDFFAGVSVVACGHCNPRIAEASVKQLQTLQHTTTIYLTQPMADLAERLANGILPGRLSRTFFLQQRLGGQ